MNYNWKKIIFTGVLALVLAFSPIRAQKSEAWLEFAGEMLEHSLTMLRETINGIIMGSLKQAAVRMLNGEISVIISGTSSGNTRIIVNYRDFLDVEPTQRTNVYINDYLSQITRGRGSYSGYIPHNEGFGNGAFLSGMSGGNYVAQLRQSALSNVSERREPQLTYVGNPRQNMFAEGNMNNFLTYLSGINNPWAFNSHVERKYQERLATEKEAAQMEAINGHGFKSTRQGDNIITPGYLIGQNMANVQNLGFSIIANARSAPEVVTSVVQNVVTQSMQNGIGNIQRNIQREVQSVSEKSNTALNVLRQSNGPGAIYNGNTGSTWKNPDNPSSSNSPTWQGSNEWKNPDIKNTN